MGQAETEWSVALARHLSSFMGKPVRIQRMDMVPLKAGYISKAVDRLDLTLAALDGTVSTA